MSSNIFEFEDEMIVCGSCLPNMDKTAFEAVQKLSNNIAFVCLECYNMNTVAHKISSILEEGKVRKIFFISVDKSPHCIQLHHIKREIEKVFGKNNIEFRSFVSSKGELVEVSNEIISLSKNFKELKNLIGSKK